MQIRWRRGVLVVALLSGAMATAVNGTARAETGADPLRLHIDPFANAPSSFDLQPGEGHPAPAGLTAFTFGNTEPDHPGLPWLTAEVTLAPCAGPLPDDPDMVVRRGQVSTTTLLVPPGSCLFTNTGFRLLGSAVTLGTLSNDPTDPVFVDIADAALAPIDVPYLGSPDHPTPPFDTAFVTSGAVPAGALFDVLVLESDNGATISGDVDRCGAPGPDVPLAVGAARRNVAVVPHGGCAHLTVQDPVDATLLVTVAGYLAFDPTPPTPWTFPHFRYHGSVAPELVPRTPTRLFDTRVDGAPVEAGYSRVLDLSSLGPDVSAVVLNVTVTEPLGPGYVTVYPCDVDPPLASNLNMAAGETAANQVTVGLLASRQLCFYTSTRAHLLADLEATYDLGRGDGFVPVQPVRLFDTRLDGPVPADGTVHRLELAASVSADTTAVSVNTTVTDAVTPGFVTVYPCDDERPLASNLNYAAGATRANLVTVKVGPSRAVCFYVHGRAQLLADLSGYYATSVQRGFIDVVPVRIVDTRSGTTGGAGPTVLAGTWMDALAVNITATRAQAPGFVTAYDCRSERPLASTVNYMIGQTVPNAAVLPLYVQPNSISSAGCLYRHTSVDVVVDVTGYFSSAEDYVYDAIAV